MKNQGKMLFQIGEVTQIMGITRKTLLVLEAAGLLSPAVKDPESGYRYYTVDDLTQIRLVRTLQTAGLTLKEISGYLADRQNLEPLLERLLVLRKNLDQSIRALQVRMVQPGDMTVHEITLPRQVCFARQYPFRDVSGTILALREVYFSAVKSGMLSAERMFTLRVPVEGSVPDILCCVPMVNTYQGPERMEFPETDALCVYHRGAYEQLPAVTQALLAHLKAHNIQPAGPVRAIYLEGPPNRGSNTAEYITQLAVPIKK